MRMPSTTWLIAGCQENLEAGSWGVFSSSISRSSILRVNQNMDAANEITTYILLSISNLG